MSSPSPIGSGEQTVAPYLLVTDVPALIDFLERAFAAEEIRRIVRADGSFAHVELRIGRTSLVASSANEYWPAMPCMIQLYLADVDAWYKRALAAGATSVKEAGDPFYGDVLSCVRDSAGNLWWIVPSD